MLLRFLAYHRQSASTHQSMGGDLFACWMGPVPAKRSRGEYHGVGLIYVQAIKTVVLSCKYMKYMLQPQRCKFPGGLSAGHSL